MNKKSFFFFLIFSMPLLGMQAAQSNSDPAVAARPKGEKLPLAMAHVLPNGNTVQLSYFPTVPMLKFNTFITEPVDETTCNTYLLVSKEALKLNISLTGLKNATYHTLGFAVLKEGFLVPLLITNRKDYKLEFARTIGNKFTETHLLISLEGYFHNLKLKKLPENKFRASVYQTLYHESGEKELIKTDVVFTENLSAADCKLARVKSYICAQKTATPTPAPADPVATAAENKK